MQRNYFDQDQDQPQIQYDDAGDKIIKGRQLTLQQKQNFQKIKKLHRQNMTKQQIVKGKVFKGASFISKPERIVFKDFTVGQTHSQTIQLTNVSNAFNSFNILPLNEHIRNYFQIEYVPQGKISPGLSCSITVKFTAINNQDIQDQFYILAETGRIGYPIVCTSKKSIVSCAEPTVDFGDVIFGEKETKELILENTGSLATQFQFKILTDSSIAQEPNPILKFQKQGRIQGNSQLKILFQISPKQLSKGSQRLQINFSNFKHSPPIIIDINWNCIDLPIYIQRQMYDCELVLAKHIYRRKLVFFNRSKNTMKINIHQPPDTKDFFEFNPMMGFIQGNSEFQIWIKIILEKKPEVYLKNYHLGDGVFEVEFKAVASEQVMPVSFKVRFKLTSDVVKIDPQIIQFGNIYEGSAGKSIATFQNTGQLIQQILLYPIPKCILIQQNKSSFKVLPHEKIDITLIYQPDPLTGTRSRKDDGQLCFKIISGSLSTQDRRIKYEAMILRKQLQISKSKLQFPAIQVDEKYEASLEIKNVTSKELQFQVYVPLVQIAGLNIIPVVGKLKANESCQLFVEYQAQHRQLTYDLLEQMTKPKETIKEEVQVTQPIQTNKKQPKKQIKKQPKLTKQQMQQQQLQRKQKQQEQKLKQQQQQQQRELKLSSFNSSKELFKYGGKLVKFEDTKVYVYYWTIPIYYKFKGDTNQSSRATFIQIVTTTTAKKLNISQSVIDFEHVVVGTRQTRNVFISSLSQKEQQLYKNQLPAFSGFGVVNALRTVSQNKKFNLVVEFTPYQEQPFKETLRIHTETGSINCELKGRGIRPQILLTPENGILSLGGVIVEQYVEKSFKLKNLTEFNITFNLKVIREGIHNKDNINALTYIPKQGVIQGNKQMEIKVKFKPDRVSDLYYNLINIEIPEQKNPKSIYIFGYSYPKQAYVNNFKPLKLYQSNELTERVEYAFDSLSVSDSDKVFNQNNNKIYLTFQKIEKNLEPVQACFKQKIIIGSCKVLDSKLEKPVNFEVIMPKDDKFTVDVSKGAVPAGTETVMTFTYKPPEVDKLIENIPVFQNIGQWKDIKVDLKVSGGFVKPGVTDAVTYEVILKAYSNQI